LRRASEPKQAARTFWTYQYQLVVETPQASLVAGMKWFLSTYTGRWFNRRHKLFGHAALAAVDNDDAGVDCGALGDGECEHGDALFAEAIAMNQNYQLSGLTPLGPLADPHIPIDPKTIVPGDYWENSMNIYYDKNATNPTIAICGEPNELRRLGDVLLKSRETIVRGEQRVSEFYPEVLDELVFRPKNAAALLTISIEGRSVVLAGGAGAARNIGQSLLNVFSGDVVEGEHFHLDYFEGNGILAQTNFHLIFQCEGRDT
jgi:hypothetical protein